MLEVRQPSLAQIRTMTVISFRQLDKAGEKELRAGSFPEKDR